MFRNLVRSAFRIAFFLRVTEDAVAASWMQVAGAILANLIPPIVFAALQVGTDGHIDWTYLPGVLFQVPVLLVTAIVIDRILQRDSDVKAVLMAGLLSWTVIDAISLPIWAALYQVRLGHMFSMAFYYGPVAWLALAIARFSLSLSPLSMPRRAWVVAACAILLALPLGGIYRERSLWTMDYSKSSADNSASRTDVMAAAGEHVFYRQPELLTGELAELKPGRKGVVDVFLVGMAGFGPQDVFMHEVDSVSTLFRERFHAEGHIVKLVNNPKTLLSEPIASVTSLKASLARVAELMNGDEDVLVLFLTSHGSTDHHLSLELWPIQFEPLTPAVLREVLDASGIKNRVVIVSACYSGGFVQPLAGDNTLVITASAADRNSFGCGNENQWTYFGKAYFDEALRKSGSFIAAFEAAKPVIAEREKQDKFDPSMPQMSAGNAIREKLAQLEKQQAAQARSYHGGTTREESP